jgi:hypothetical protein
MRDIIKRLRLPDQAWQVISITIGVLAIIVSVFITYDVYQKSVQLSALTVHEVFHFDPVRFLFGEAMEDRIALMVDGSPIESTTIYYYQLSNTGRSPILPTDYIEPVQVSVSPGKGELLTVDTTRTYPPELEVGWSKVTTSTFSMEPVLLNPGDEIGVLLFITDIPDSDETPQVDWKARLVGISSLEVQDEETPAEESGLGAFYLGISHYGWSLYWLAVLSLLFYVGGLLLAMRFKRLTRFSATQIVLLVTLMAFSFSSAEIVVDVFYEGDASHQWWGAWVLLGFHTLFLLYISWPGIRAKLVSILVPDDFRRESTGEEES